MVVEYNDITTEIRKLGLTMQQVADLMGITRQGLYYRIQADKAERKPSLHWAIYGIANYYGELEGERNAS